jgi:NAD(P)-dependent dehydrogenase (short-subunit alcohol dehydrogenase family)
MASQQRDRVLITGGASGIGAAIADRCRADGYDVVVLDRRGDGIIVDLADPDATAEALDHALEAGPITRLVNNVGVVFAASAETQSLDELGRAWMVNVASALQCTQRLLPGMQRAGFGRIVSISSRAALGKELRSAYASTKSALIGLTRVWALEQGAFGITANAVAPGPIETELFREANPVGSPRTQAIVDHIPVGRMGTPEDVANAASFLLDSRAGFVTGQTLYVCGGVSVGRLTL